MSNNFKFIGKKAQIGATLTWFPAFLIIVFLMALFIIASALFSVTKSVHYIPISEINGKSANLEFAPGEPKGYDSGDSALKRDMVSFLNSEVDLQGSKVYVKDLISSFDESVYGVNHRFSAEEVESHLDYKVFYNSTKSFFDNLYDECYVMCLYFEKKDSRGLPSNKQVIVGKNCSSQEVLEYDCYVSYDYITSEVFNYAELSVPSKSADYNPTKIKMLKGGISGVYYYGRGGGI
jgi:hypothetical protein